MDISNEERLKRQELLQLLKRKLELTEMQTQELAKVAEEISCKILTPVKPGANK
jgi:hypothetical protein